ncbi:ABC transporter permease [Roseomonas sp. KE0001]|uniref:ABC transporter permease n=1 Tax=Roseomonas sp. KE0001 TaxID=2479201 RepID=UPI0018DF5C9E|nr:ABC transporter permease [Roseomonas sp. KE0001]MBI0433404.1 ABC transporter permease [Roseomonas sp. KE0001]
MQALGFILRRTLLLAVVLLVVSLLTFGIVNVLPGDVATAVLGDMATPEQAAALRERLGLDEPLAQRYLAWLTALLQGDFGTSLQHGQPIAPLLMGRLGNSAILGLLTLTIAAPLAVALGIVAALRPGGLLDRLIGAIAVGAYALPEYVIGLLAILAFSIWLPVLPGTSLMDPNENPLARPEALVLPVCVLITGMLAFISQITRASMIQVMASPYVRTAILKGVPFRRVVLKHALPNLLPPTITEIGMYLGYVIGGLVVVETLFSYAGLGQLVTNAVSYRDVPVIQATVLLVAAAYGIGNLLADVVALLLTPRLRA